MLDRYVEQVRLLVKMLPYIAKEDSFALKGGTAINLFYRNLPRLSIDIDLTYLPIEDRDTSLRHIDEALGRIMDAISKSHQTFRLRRIAGGGNGDTRIMVGKGQTQIKIETSPVSRGAVHTPVRMVASDAAVEQFGFTEMPVLAFEDLYGGKLHAALDRQHPRDLFDIKLLYENEGLTDDLFKTFMVYVASSGRPMHELLAPNCITLEILYAEEFSGMTRDPVDLQELEDVRLRLYSDISQGLKGDIAVFLLSLHDAVPDFSLIGRPDAEQLPAVRWKLMNLEKLKRNNPAKHAEQRELLAALFQ